MAVSETQIANLALIQLGDKTITNLLEDSEPARKMNTIYELKRDEILSVHPWNFAIAEAELAALPDPPLTQFDIAYQLPADYLRLVSLENNQIEHRIVQDQLHTDETTIKILYIFRQTDVTKYHDAFVAAFASYLALTLAYSITQSFSMIDRMEKDYTAKLAIAKTIDAHEGTPRQVIHDEWERSRRIFTGGFVQGFTDPPAVP